MTLEVPQPPAMLAAGGFPEGMEADVVEGRRRGEAGDVPAELEVLAPGAQHHCHRVPAHQRANAVLDAAVARQALLEVRRNRVEVGGLRAVRKVGARAARLVDELLEEEMRALRPLDLEHGLEG